MDNIQLHTKKTIQHLITYNAKITTAEKLMTSGTRNEEKNCKKIRTPGFKLIRILIFQSLIQKLVE